MGKHYSNNLNQMTMIRLITIATCILCCILSVSTFAQLTINPKFGVNISAVEGEPAVDSDALRVGWNAGVDVRWKLDNDWFFVAPGAHYYKFTANLLSDSGFGEFNEAFKLSTVQKIKIPLNVGVDLTGDFDIVNVLIKGGITPSILLGVDMESGDPFLSSIRSEDDLETLSWGANIGIGIELFFLSLDLNYEKGLSDFYDGQRGIDGGNDIISLNVGVSF